MAQAHADAEKYYVPHSSPWPIYGSVTLFTLMSGAIALPIETQPLREAAAAHAKIESQQTVGKVILVP